MKGRVVACAFYREPAKVETGRGGGMKMAPEFLLLSMLFVRRQRFLRYGIRAYPFVSFLLKDTMVGNLGGTTRASRPMLG